MPKVILPETVVHHDGVGGAVALDLSSSPWQLTLDVTRILEQESIEVTVCGSPDAEHWLPLVKFPRKFYCGTYAHHLDLGAHPGVRYVRAEWRMRRWGLIDAGVLCTFSLHAAPARVLHAGAA